MLVRLIVWVRPGGLKLYGAFVGANRTIGKIFTGAIVGAAVGGWIRFIYICAGYIEDDFPASPFSTQPLMIWALCGRFLDPEQPIRKK